MEDLVTYSDLLRRWIYSDEGIRKLIKRDGAFPRPSGYLNRRQSRIWREADIKRYESTRPWLLDEGAKRREQQLRMKRIAGNSRMRGR